ncbi:MAG: PQQ-dependent sugar dehydrogenase [Roseibacillus sp.]
MTKVLCLLSLSILGGALVRGQIPERVANTTLQMPPAILSLEPYQLEDAQLGSVGSPVDLVSPPNDDRLFVVDQGGRIFVIPDLANPVPEEFLDLTDRVESGTGEEGLLGMAFHPNYATNGYFYVFYTQGNPSPLIVHDDVLARFTVDASDADLGDATSESVLIRQPGDEWGRNHNGGDLEFGGDGFLYVSLGDGGDRRNAQKIDRDFYSAVMRIDVDGLPGSLAPNPHPSVVGSYWVPSDNPFVGATEFNGLSVAAADLRTEFFAVGLRNPWRFSIDSGSGSIFLGDVGENDFEEVNSITAGGNYGWPFREGTGAGVGTPPAGVAFVEPINAYGRNAGLSVIGGVVYRGSRLPELSGTYLFTDWGNGEIRGLIPNGANPVPYEVVATSYGFGPRAFGEDPRNGDVLIAYGDSVQRIVRNLSEPTDSLPPTLSATGAFSNLASLVPEAGILPYQINAPFWSDGADKSRWLSVPEVADQIGYDSEGPFTFPTGSVWIKHFDIELTEGDPATARRLETRFLVKTETDVYGVTYRWNPSQTDAVLVPEEGATEDLNRIIDGLAVTQRWDYPSRSNCISCHTPDSGWALGFDSAQLNRTRLFGSEDHNQLSALNTMGYFENTPPSHRSLPALAPTSAVDVSVEFRARSYLQANCANCHDGSGLAAWDGRLQTPLAEAGIINGVLGDNGDNTASRVIVPGSPTNSMLLSRISTRGSSQMPPISSHVVDEDGVALITAWINELAGYQTYEEWSLATAGEVLARTADFDHDGLSNDGEYLLGLSPVDPMERLCETLLSFETPNQSPTLSFDYLSNRAYEIEYTDHLDSPWQFLDLDDNQIRYRAAGGTATFLDTSAPPAEGHRFYRLQISGP